MIPDIEYITPQNFGLNFQKNSWSFEKPYQTIKTVFQTNSPFQKLLREHVQAFGATISGIVWVASVACDWLTVTLNTIDQS